MKLTTDPKVPAASSQTFLQRLYDLFRAISFQVNGISEGRIESFHTAATSAPTAGTYQKGDFVYNSSPSEVTNAGFAYVLTGWRCVTSGTPGTWVEERIPTGGSLSITAIYKATATLDFPSIASSGSSELTMTVTGATAGQFVVLAAPAALESGLAFSGFVSAANTVSVRLHNNSGGSINPASASWSATVFTLA